MPSEVKNKVVQFNIDHFSLFAIVDFSKTEPKDKIDKPKGIVLDAKKEMSNTNKINEKENITTISKNLDFKSKEVTQVVEKNYNIRNNRENSRSNVKVEKLDSSNDNLKQNSILPKTGDSSSSELPIVAGVGFIIGALGIRKYKR